MPLVAWNVCLALFSLLGLMRTSGFVLSFLRLRGLHSSVCVEPVVSGPYGFWCWLFVLSKVPELGDTVFIVLRKQPLIFLHWFHHMSVLLLVWVANSDSFSIGGSFITMNFAVHSFMYSYFACKAMGLRVPKVWAQGITSSQLLQMVVGTAVCLYCLHQRLKGEGQEGEGCGTHPLTLYLSLGLYAAYLVLFANFFCSSYLKGVNLGGKVGDIMGFGREKGQKEKDTSENNNLRDGKMKHQ